MTANYINNTNNTVSTGSGAATPNLPADPTDFTNPDTPKMWINTTDGKLRYWNGVRVVTVDENEGQNISVFGQDLGDV